MHLAPHDVPDLRVIPVGQQRVLGVVGRRVAPDRLDHAQGLELALVDLARARLVAAVANRRLELIRAALEIGAHIHEQVAAPEESVVARDLVKLVADLEPRLIVLERLDLVGLARGRHPLLALVGVGHPLGLAGRVLGRAPPVLVLVAGDLEVDPLAGGVVRDRLRDHPILRPLGELGQVRVAEEQQALGGHTLEHGLRPLAAGPGEVLVHRHPIRFGRHGLLGKFRKLERVELGCAVAGARGLGAGPDDRLDRRHRIGGCLARCRVDGGPGLDLGGGLQLWPIDRLASRTWSRTAPRHRRHPSPFSS